MQEPETHASTHTHPHTLETHTHTGDADEASQEATPVFDPYIQRHTLSGISGTRVRQALEA